ncbi:dienelactone hydrolase family protein [Micromonosporaceae bacterium Da 78-11]
MCHSTQSKPPAAPVTGTVEKVTALELTASDGATFGAFLATPGEPNGRNVVILPDVRGAHAYYRELTRRFAEAGFGALVIDYYGRTAGVGERLDDFDWQRYLPSVRADQVALDVQAAQEHLTSVNPGSVFSVGFCFGGGQSWRLAASGFGLAGTIGFYGRPEPVTEVIDRIELPMLLLIAGADVATPQAEFQALGESLARAGVDHELVTYPGAPHSFFDRSAADWQDACDDAWRRIIDFTERHGSTGPQGSGRQGSGRQG